MRLCWLLLLVGCGSRVDSDRAPPEVPEGTEADALPALDDLGCDDEGGPCMLPGPHYWDGASELCLTGTGFGTAGTLIWNGRARETSSWSDASVCVAASTPEYDAMVQVIRDDQRRSNREAVVTPAFDLEWSVPEPLREGTVYTITGQNLGAVVFPGVSTGEVFQTPAVRGVSIDYRKAGFDPIAGPSITVHPDIRIGCAAGPNQPCTIGGLGFDHSALVGANPTAYQVRLDGSLVGWDDWTANTVSFDWPAGTTPGMHTVEITLADGTTDSVEVELLDRDVVSMTNEYTDFSTIRQVDPYQPDPFSFDGLTMQSGEFGGRGIGGFPVLDAIRHLRVLDADAGRGVESFVGPYGRVVEWDGGLWNLSIDGAVPITIDPTDLDATIDLSATRGFDLGNPDDFVVAAHVRQGDLVVATFSAARIPNIWHVTPPDAATNLGTLAGTDLLTVAYSSAVWINDDAIWSGSCGNEDFQSELWITPLEASSGLALGTPALVWAPAGAEKALACRADDDGFVFVVGDGTSAATVYRHSLSGGLETLGSLPTTLPGQGVALPDSGDSPVESIAVGSDGTLVALLADRTDYPHALTLATSADGSSWTTSAVFGTRMPDLHGDTCVGRASACEPAEDEPTQCLPAACPIEQRTLVDWRGNPRGVQNYMQIFRAGMLLDGDGVWVQYEVSRGPTRPYAESEYRPHTVLMERVPLP